MTYVCGFEREPWPQGTAAQCTVYTLNGGAVYKGRLPPETGQRSNERGLTHVCMARESQSGGSGIYFLSSDESVWGRPRLLLVGRRSQRWSKGKVGRSSPIIGPKGIGISRKELRS